MVRDKNFLIINLTFVADQINNKSEEQFREIVTELGGWPVLVGNSWEEDNKKFDWKEKTYAIRKLGYPFSYFIATYTASDARNNSRKLIHVSYFFFIDIYITNINSENQYNTSW